MWIDNLLTFVELGFRHILPLGWDHVLFIAAMYLAATSWRALLIQVTAFTLAHTVALALAVSGVIDLPPELVEPIIALSIVVVAISALLKRAKTSWKTTIVLAFGLLHGLGFAGVIRGYLEGADFITGLIGFNLGVELGQLAVLAIVGVVMTLIRMLLASVGKADRFRAYATIPAVCMIAAVATLMFLSRLPVVGEYLPAL